MFTSHSRTKSKAESIVFLRADFGKEQSVILLLITLFLYLLIIYFYKMEVDNAFVQGELNLTHVPVMTHFVLA